MNKSHVFQHNTTGVQIFVYHCIDETTAREEFRNIVLDQSRWIYIGLKTAI